MKLHILGICGTFMGSLALIARQQGHEVTGSDSGVYPPMSTLLAEQGIPCCEGYLPEYLDPAPDCIIIGNALSRGNPAVEYLLAHNLNYLSGPQWLAEQVLHRRHVLAVAGTHGKTTASAMLAWILEYAGLNPGFLIGGVPLNFGISARYTDSPFFVIEADEYDTAFFDKRAKFVHYRPRTLILNNLEYDHADIFPDLAAIQRQFHHLVRIVPGNGLIIHNGTDSALDAVLAQGCWTPRRSFVSGDWHCQAVAGGNGFEIYQGASMQGRVIWDQAGVHNRHNALAAVVAAVDAGVTPMVACAALEQFKGVKRRLEAYGTVNGITLYDDFAHHPTAIRLTLQALRSRCKDGRIIAVVEPRSNTMRLGVHRDTLGPALADADLALVYQSSGLDWQLPVQDNLQVFDSVAEIVEHVHHLARSGDHVVIMSNGGFEGIHGRLSEALAGG